MEISKASNSFKVQKNKEKFKKEAEVKLNKKEVEAEAQKALEQMGRAQLKLNFKGKSNSASEPLTYDQKQNMLKDTKYRDVFEILRLPDSQFIFAIKAKDLCYSILDLTSLLNLNVNDEELDKLKELKKACVLAPYEELIKHIRNEDISLDELKKFCEVGFTYTDAIRLIKSGRLAKEYARFSIFGLHDETKEMLLQNPQVPKDYERASKMQAYVITSTFLEAYRLKYSPEKDNLDEVLEYSNLLDKILTSPMYKMRIEEYSNIPIDRVKKLNRVLASKYETNKIDEFISSCLLLDLDDILFDKALALFEKDIEIAEIRQYFLIKKQENNENSAQICSLIENGFKIDEIQSYNLVENYAKVVKLLGYALKANEILYLLEYEIDEIQKIVDILKQGIPIESAIIIAKKQLTQEEIQKIVEMINNGYSFSSAIELFNVELEEDKKQKASKYIDVEIQNAISIVQNIQQQTLLDELLELKLNPKYLRTFYEDFNQNPNKFYIMRNLLLQGVSENNVLGYLTDAFDDEENQELAAKLMKIGVSYSSVKPILSNASNPRAFVEMLEEKQSQGCNIETILYYFKRGVEGESLERAIELSKFKLNSQEISSLIDADKEYYDRILSYLKCGSKFKEAEKSARENHDIRLVKINNKYRDVFNYGFDIFKPNEIQENYPEFMTDNNIEKFEQFIKRGIFVETALLTAIFDYADEAEIDRVCELLKRGIWVYTAKLIASDIEKYNQVIARIGKNNDGVYSLKENEYSDTMLEEAYKIFRQYNISLENALEFRKNHYFKQYYEDKILKYLIQGLEYEEAEELGKAEFENEQKQYYITEAGYSEELAEALTRNYERLYFDEYIEKIASLVNEGADPDCAISMVVDKHTSSVIPRNYIDEFHRALAQGYPPRVAQILALTIKEAKNPELAEKLVDDDFIKKVQKKVSNPALNQTIEEIFNVRKYNARQINELFQAKLSYEDIIDGIAKLSKSPLKLALKKPNQYLSNIPLEYTTKVNGKYPDLPPRIQKKYQEQIQGFFKNNSGLLLRAIKYLDNDTFNQLMDKRTENFKESLLLLNELNDEDYALISNLLKLKNHEGKNLTAKDKIELAKITVYLQRAKMLKGFEFVEDGKLKSFNKIHEEVTLLAFKALGFSKEEIEKIPEEKLDFDKEYFYSIFNMTASATFDMFKEFYLEDIKDNESARKQRIEELIKIINSPEELAHNGWTREMGELLLSIYENFDKLSEDEIFDIYIKIFQQQQGDNKTAEILKAALFDDFKRYISDDSNEYGKANKQTQMLFARNNLDFNTWQNYQKQTKINLNDKEFTIKMWDRNPQKDLFIGNRTTCCTAIDATNGAATSIYLANKVFNVVELKDDNDNTVAMSRIFMANIDDEPCLIMDNIEVNSAFAKELENKETDTSSSVSLRNNFFKYIKKLAKEVTGKENAKVYFSTSYTKLPVEDLTKVSKKYEFIGNSYPQRFYCNTSKNWSEISDLELNQDAEFYIV